MKAKKIAAALALFCVAVVVCFASDAVMGTWKLNEAKSKLPAGTARNSTVVYAAAGDGVKVTVDGVDKSGNPTHNEWMGKFDGKDYPVTGDPTSDMRSYTRVNYRTLALTAKKDGKIVGTGQVVLSADGKSRTVTLSTTDPDGNQVSSTALYDKQ